MSSVSCKEIGSMSHSELDDFLNSFDTVLTDCDGVLWTGSVAIDGSPEVIQALRKLGKKVIYVTNNSTKSRKEYLTKFTDLGFGGEALDIFTPSYLSALYLKQQNFTKTVYVFGSKGIVNELDEAGIKHIGYGDDPIPENWSVDMAVEIAEGLNKDVGCVIASLTYELSYMKLMKAVSYLDNPDVIFIGTNTDPVFPVQKGCVLPGTGAFVAAVQTAACRKPIILGKPEKYMFEAVMAVHPNIKPERTLMIGDRCDTDILLGKNCGLKTLMVGTGVGTLTEVRKWECEEDEQSKRLVPDFYANKLEELLIHINRNL